MIGVGGSYMLNDLLAVSRSDAVYNAHSYLTKVPVDAIIPFIEEYTEPGDLVVDMFAGSGMTAVASKMCNRKAIVSDISALGKHIGTGYLSNVDESELRLTVNNLVSESKAHIGKYYLTKRQSDESIIEFGKTIWTFIYECSNCKSEINFYSQLKEANWNTKNIECVCCRAAFSKRGAKFIRDEAVVVSLDGENGRQTEQPISDFDLNLIESANSTNVFNEIPNVRIGEEREMYKRSALEKWNLTETKNFFTSRNAIVLLDLWERINAIENEQLRQKLRFTFTAILPRASKRYQWSYKAPLNAAIQNYYIAPVFYEWNVYDLFTRKMNAIIKSDAFIQQRMSPDSSQTQAYVTASADNLEHLESESVDFIFTDPPFGSNIFYSDMNLFHEAWLGDFTDSKNEAVMKTTGKGKERSKSDYQEILTGAFREAYRVLRQGKCMAVVFGNSQGSIWSVVQQSLFNSGFDTRPEKILILDKGQRSVKGLNSGTEKVATLDLVVVVRKSEVHKVEQTLTQISDIKPLIAKVFEDVGIKAGLTASHLYLSVLKEAMHEGLCIANIDLGDILAEVYARGFSINSMSGKLE